MRTLYQGTTVIAVALALLGATKDNTTKDDTLDRATVTRTLAELEVRGEKRVGTPQGRAAGDWLHAQLRILGLEDVHFESFHFPRHDVTSSSLSVELDGASVPLKHDVFEASGDSTEAARRLGDTTGHITADLVWVGAATPTDLADKDLRDKIALVRRDVNYDRSVQLKNVVAAGAVTMLYISTAPRNEVQIGTVRNTFESIEAIPAVTIGADDGAHILAALTSGTLGKASVRVLAATTPLAAPGEGRNVIGRIVGQDPTRQIVIGAHYDSWFIGAVDNGSGVAALLGLARRWGERLRAGAARPPYSIVFIAYDGEEVALYGGYDYLRKHHFIAHEDILAAINLEMPAGLHPSEYDAYPGYERATWGLDLSGIPVLREVFAQAGVTALYPNVKTLDVVSEECGGLIATDIQGHYRAGIATVTTDVNTPYYHTRLDTVAHTDVDALVQSVALFDRVLIGLGQRPVADFRVVDATILKARVSLGTRGSASDDLTVDVDIVDQAGAAVARAKLQVELHVDDYFQAWVNNDIVADANGHARFVIPATAVEAAPARRFLHVMAGRSFPQAEAIVVVP